jgi:hypothetical protein
MILKKFKTLKNSAKTLKIPQTPQNSPKVKKLIENHSLLAHFLSPSLPFRSVDDKISKTQQKMAAQ